MLYLSDRFRRFFKSLNVGVGIEQTAAAEYAAIKSVIEDPKGRAAALSPTCFLQGSYKQETAIHDLHDIDIVALCELWHPGSGTSGSRSWSRDEIFATVAAPLLADARYRDKVRYNAQSMCIKVDLDIKVEILPVVYKSGNNDPTKEPFRLYRPRTDLWEDGYAKYHQWYLSWKNGDDKTAGTFIPAIKVLKHIRTLFGMKAVSFHIESFLFRLADTTFTGAPVEYIPRVLNTIAAKSADDWYRSVIKTPCDDRDIFVANEWSGESWFQFHKLIVEVAAVASLARDAQTETEAVRLWRVVLGKNFFPEQ